MPKRLRPSALSLPRTSRRRFTAGTLAVAASASVVPRFLRAQESQVNVYNWDTYIAEDTIANFTQATGIDVRYDLYANNDELFAKLREGNPGYDVIYPSNDYVERMIAADMLMPLDKSKIPNAENINPAFTDPAFDPERGYSMPYFWGTAGIGFRKPVAEPTAWADMFASDKYAGRMALLNAKDTIQVALKYLGYSANTADPEHIREATELLIDVKPMIKTFAPDTGQDLLISGEVDLAMEWNGDILQVMEEDEELSYVVPREGSMLWEDCMAIPKGAPHADAAHGWIDYVLQPEVHGSIATYVRYACPNKAAMPYIPAEDKANPALYPPEDVLEKCEVSIYKGEEIESLYDEAMTRVLAA